MAGKRKILDGAFYSTFDHANHAEERSVRALTRPAKASVAKR